MSKILIVDDDPKNIKLISAILSPEGYIIESASNGEDALKNAAGSEPDLILLDVLMPKMNGFEVAKRLKSNEKTNIIPIVMVTGLADVDDRVKALEAGADDFLAKPVDITELRTRVRTLLKVKSHNDHMRNHQKELEREVAKRTEQLNIAYEKAKNASLETVYRLSRAAEYKDEETGAHIKRMSGYSVAVGKQLRLNDSTIESIQYASPMHDVGKIGIPDKILLKPGKLDPDEWDIMKKHAVIGAGILEGSDIGFIRLGEVIARTHHERWDGSGYPGGLKGREIPLVGRIVAIADVFDALTSRRPYKEPFPFKQSISIIQEGSGEHFDPDVVDAFVSVIDKIAAIREQFREEPESPFVQMQKSAGAEKGSRNEVKG